MIAMIQFARRDLNLCRAYKMEPEVKSRWIEALRSRKFIQGTKRLSDPISNSFCCLGVLCEIEKLEKQNLAHSVTYKYKDEDGKTSESETVVPFGFANKIKLNYIKGEALASLNDCEYSFEQIADIIEEYM